MQNNLIAFLMRDKQPGDTTIVLSACATALDCASGLARLIGAAPMRRAPGLRFCPLHLLPQPI
jgi:CHAT domain-containing protein